MKNLEDYNLTKKRKVLTVFDGMTTDMESNKILSPVVTELFLRERKLNISLVIISQYYFKEPKTIRLNLTHYFITKNNWQRCFTRIKLVRKSCYNQKI